MKYRCEAHESLDLARLRRDGVLTPGSTADLSWSGGLRLGLVIGPHSLTVSHSSGWRQSIVFDWTATRFDGRRMWLSCPDCGSRRRVLHFAGRFACRACLDLRYESEYEDGLSRYLRRFRRLRAKIDSTALGTFALKPRGMHWRTYHRLRDLDRQLEKSTLAAFGSRYGWQP